MRRGMENAFGDRDLICFSSETKKAEDGLRSARESSGNNRNEGVHVAVALAPFLVNGAQQVRHLLQKRECTSDNHASARQCVEWPRVDLFGYIIQVESRVTGTAV
ncbi:hypothetical protein ACH5RR_000999 [Cinchona calisaya]|uniref:Uncharacterized protein n=1 Tax=Cinchona calisaya TaxID=153742 RepID=A0ABD3B2Y8_9GENT